VTFDIKSKSLEHDSVNLNPARLPISFSPLHAPRAFHLCILAALAAPLSQVEMAGAKRPEIQHIVEYHSPPASPILNPVNVHPCQAVHVQTLASSKCRSLGCRRLHHDAVASIIRWGPFLTIPGCQVSSHNSTESRRSVGIQPPGRHGTCS
jgi:hypothetical protein